MSVDRLLERDREARRLAQRELQRPLVLEAGAGTGKTATLVARALAWASGPGWDRSRARLAERPLSPALSGRREEDRVAIDVLRGMVAITFTEAAAAELAERVTRGFIALQRGTLPTGFEPPEAIAAETLSRRGGYLTAAADQLQVRTIHAFCRKLLAEHPLEAGLHPGFTVDADGSAVREVVEEVAQSVLLEAYGEPGDPDFLGLAARGIDPARLAELALSAVESGLTADQLAADPFAEPRCAALAARLRVRAAAVRDFLRPRLVDPFRGPNARRLLAACEALVAILEDGDIPPADRIRRAGSELPRNLRQHLRGWARGRVSRSEGERFADDLPCLRAASRSLGQGLEHVAALDPELLGLARRSLLRLLRPIRRELRRRGLVTFADLLRGADRLLETRPGLTAHLRRRIDQLMVDEFQDTDRLQCTIVRRLALEGPADERPGLFVVGDPKQSIYGWRDADLRAYEDFVAAVETGGGRRLVLAESFRSVPAILEEVGRAVAPIMRPSAGHQPAYEPLLACARLQAASGFAEPPRGAVEHWISWLPDGSEPTAPIAGRAGDTAELEARAIAADVRDLHAAHGVAWREVALLLRSMTDVDTYLGALRDRGIPFLVSRDRQYYRRREIIDTAALVRAVLAPEDHVALLTFLRSTTVGVPDAALIPLWSRGFPAQMTTLLGPASDRLRAVHETVRAAAAAVPPVPGLERVDGWHHNLHHAVDLLADLRGAFEELPADELVERLRRISLAEVSEAGRYLGAYRLANVRRFFRELTTALEEERGDRHRVLRRLRRQVRQGFEAPEAQPAEAIEDAVRVLTIHAAKGLEFPHVYLPQLHKPSGGPWRRDLETGEVDGTLEYRLLASATPGCDRLDEHRQRTESAERVRTLYVAMTRARERLVLVSRPPLDAEPPPLEEAQSHADLLLHRRGSPSSGELAASWDAGELWHQGVRWRLVGRQAAERLVDRPERSPTPPDAAALRRRSQRLREAQEAAARQMARPFRSAASQVDGEELPGVAETDAPAAAGLPTAGRRLAMAAGSLVHRVLERFDLEADPDAELERQLGLLGTYLAALGGEEAARPRAELLLDRFRRGQLFRRFIALRPHVLGREIALLAPPPAAPGPVGFVTGAIDLLYRDPEGGALVVADFKTDAVDSEPELRERTDRYATQGAIYLRAVQEALALPATPRFELWYLYADRVIVGPATRV